jgi:hypothetical protein
MVDQDSFEPSEVKVSGNTIFIRRYRKGPAILMATLSEFDYAAREPGKSMSSGIPPAIFVAVDLLTSCGTPSETSLTFSSRTNCSGSRVTESARKFPSSCSRLRGPMIGTIAVVDRRAFSRTQASATCVADVPVSLAIARTSSRIAVCGLSRESVLRRSD